MMGDNYTINPDYLARVKEIVDWAIDAKLYVINRLKIINMDLFYNPYKLHINFNDRFTKIENEQNITQKIVIIIICLVIIFIIFIFYRSHQRKKRLNEINFERKNISLSEEDNESNKLF